MYCTALSVRLCCALTSASASPLSAPYLFKPTMVDRLRITALCHPRSLWLLASGEPAHLNPRCSAAPCPPRAPHWLTRTASSRQGTLQPGQHPPMGKRPSQQGSSTAAAERLQAPPLPLQSTWGPSCCPVTCIGCRSSSTTRWTRAHASSWEAAFFRLPRAGNGQARQARMTGPAGLWRGSFIRQPSSLTWTNQ